jgi:uncharacterized membrane protein
MQMPWWANAYIVVLGAVGAFAGVDHLRNRRYWWAAGEVLSTAAAIFFAAAFMRPQLRVGSGWLMVAMLLAVLTWEIVSAADDLRHPDGDQPSDHAATIAGVVIALVLVAPAIGAGAWLAWRALAG